MNSFDQWLTRLLKMAWLAFAALCCWTMWSCYQYGQQNHWHE